MLVQDKAYLLLLMCLSMPCPVKMVVLVAAVMIMGTVVLVMDFLSTHSVMLLIHFGPANRIALVAEVALKATSRETVVMIIIGVEMVELMVETVIRAHMKVALVLRTLALPAQAAHMVGD